MKNTKATRKIAAMLAAVMMMTTTAAIGASADAAPSARTGAAHTACAGSKQSSWEIRDRYERNMIYFQNLEEARTHVEIDNDGLYQAKNIKLYGREVIDVDEETGDFILGDWEIIRNFDKLTGLTGYRFEISGSYVAFAFSFDVTWGTDFPFSGVFFDDIYNIYEDDIHITLKGCVRTAGIKIKVGSRTVVDQSNCSAHKEWIPVNDDE